MQRYKVIYRNGQFRYFMANSESEARGKARADLRTQRRYEYGIGRKEGKRGVYGGPEVREQKAYPVHSGIEKVEKG